MYTCCTGFLDAPISWHSKSKSALASQRPHASKRLRYDTIQLSTDAFVLSRSSLMKLMAIQAADWTSPVMSM